MSSTFTNLYNSVHRTSLLTEAAVDAFGHVNVITSCPPAAVSTRLCLYGNSLDRDIVEHRTIDSLRVYISVCLQSLACRFDVSKCDCT